MSRRIFVISMLGIALTGSAFAADLPVKAAPMAPVMAPVFSWTGFYIGGHVGGVWGRDDGSITNPGVPVAINLPFTINAQNVIGGGHAGFNVQVSQFVFGVEGSVDWTGLRKSFVVGVCPLFCGNATTKTDYQAAFVGRAGIAFDRLLLYGSGGVAFTNITNTYDTTPFGGGFASISQDRTGWTAGAGLEYAVTNNWLVRGEYRYTDFGNFVDKSSVAFFPATNVNRHLTENQAQIGLSYKFGMSGPVVAKY
jgi:outer membrane immunogenic protein